MLYSFCDTHSIPYKKTSKLIVATNPSQTSHINHLLDHNKSLPTPVPLKLLTGSQARELEPDLGPNITAALLSPETGILDTHAYMDKLEGLIADSGRGEVVYGTKVVRIDPADGGGGAQRGGKRGGNGDEDGWVVQMVTGGDDGERSSILAKTVVNAAGLNAHHILNQILRPSERQPLYFAKGSYFSYRGPGVKTVCRLLYPCPEPGLAGLGTHLTMSMGGDIRFGPDVEWLDPPRRKIANSDEWVGEGEEDEADFWEKHLAPSETRMRAAFEQVQKYLPGVVWDGFAPDYSGIRPKLGPPGSTTPSDFMINHPRPGFINLMGVESPGLTSSMAIAEYVEALIRKEIWGTRETGGKGRKVSEIGKLDDWA